MSVKVKRHGRGSMELLDAKLLAKIERKDRCSGRSYGKRSLTRDQEINFDSLEMAKKPIMEKKRRKRINDSLNELKNILLEIMKKDPSQTAKLEKADILEFTVQYLRNSLALTKFSSPHKNYSNFQTTSSSSLFLAGWRLCLTDVTGLLRTLNFPLEITNFVVEKLNVQLFRHQIDHHRSAAFFNGQMMATNSNTKTLNSAKQDTSHVKQSNQLLSNKNDGGLWRPW
uniref:BHLH domain-containing protein n=1 Tax=Romanomermis culicivorax TaxID=13658 RepID=A0A915JI48_ROMCU